MSSLSPGLLSFEVVKAEEGPGIDGSPPPAEGDWVIDVDTDVRGQDITINGNITVQPLVTFHVHRSNVTVNGGMDWPSKLTISTQSSMQMDNSSVRVDSFEARIPSTVLLDRTELYASVSIQVSCYLLRVQNSTIQLVARDGQVVGEAGKGAALNLSGEGSSALMNSTVSCKGGNASGTLPGLDGQEGGRAEVRIVVPVIAGCDISVGAGGPADGGGSISAFRNGMGGHGADAVLALRTGQVEDITILVEASAGGNGARGSDNTAGNAGDGGNGAHGGRGEMSVTATGELIVRGCGARIRGGDGGSPGNGGMSYSANGGNAGDAGEGGEASLVISASGDMTLSGLDASAEGGRGAFGGDYGRQIGATSKPGLPTPGSRGGDSRATVSGEHNCSLRNVTLSTDGGDAWDGGSGYDQGATGGNGGDAVVSVRMGERIDSEDTNFTVRGGNGGNGGPAFSNILGNGGNGGNSTLEVVGNLSIEMRRFKLPMIPGTGGKGNTPIWNGKTGIATFDLMTEYLEMWDGSLPAPLDDLSGHDMGWLYNCSFDFDGFVAHPREEAEVWLFYPVDVWVVDSFSPEHREPLAGYEVSIATVATNEIVKIGETDELGRVSFYLGSFHYTSDDIYYDGGYFVTVRSPDRRSIKEVRLDVTGPIQWPTPFIVVVTITPHRVMVTIETPQDEADIHLSRMNGSLEVEGYAFPESGQDSITEAFLELYRQGEANGSGARLVLQQSLFELVDIPDEGYKWGRFFRPGEGSTKWRFFGRIDLFGGPPADSLTSDDYAVSAHAFDGTLWGIDIVSCRLTILRDMDPTVAITTDVRTIDWNITKRVTLNGTAWDDIGVVAVQMRVDSGEWRPVNGTTVWSGQLDVAELPEGFHTIALRASDGSHYSPEATITMSIDRPEDDGDGPDGGPFASAPTWLWLVLIIVVAALVTGALVWRHRRRRGTA